MLRVKVNQGFRNQSLIDTCLLYTSDAADEARSVDLGGRRIIKKKKNQITINIIISDLYEITIRNHTIIQRCAK
ncbi:hypothetical protein PVA38_11845 [Streptococcus pneumoniae D39]|nr:hypothetical protein PVA38_11845 [Streptococcus pneumoniae D39]